MAIVQRRGFEGVYRGPFWRSSYSYFRIPFCRCTLKEVAHPRRAKTRTKSHFAVMRYVTSPYVRPFCVADLIPREEPSVQIVLMNGRVKTARKNGELRAVYSPKTTFAIVYTRRNQSREEFRVHYFFLLFHTFAQNFLTKKEGQDWEVNQNLIKERDFINFKKASTAFRSWSSTDDCETYRSYLSH